jgi:hypothetical protein
MTEGGSSPLSSTLQGTPVGKYIKFRWKRVSSTGPTAPPRALPHLEDLKPFDKGREARQALAAAAAHADEQRVATWLLDDAAYAADVLDGEEEEDQVHGLVAGRVEVFQVRLHHFHQRRLVRDLVVLQRQGVRKFRI